MSKKTLNEKEYLKNTHTHKNQTHATHKPTLHMQRNTELRYDKDSSVCPADKNRSSGIA